MNPRTTAILFVIAAALAAFVHYYEIGGEEARKGAEEAEKRLFPDVEQAAVESISIVTADGMPVSIERREGGWQIVAPIDFAADRFAVDGIASALAQLARETVIEDPSPREVYGLDSEETEIQFSAGGVEYVLRTGDSTPVDANAYVSIDGDSRVFTVAGYRSRSLRKSLNELRDKRIADFDQYAVKRFTASWPDGRVVVERDGDGWRLVEPLEGPADVETVDALLSALALLSAEGFIDDPAPGLEASFEPPEFAVEIELSIMATDPGQVSTAGQVPTTVRIAFGGIDDTTSQRLVRGVVPSLYTIPATSLDEFPRSLIAYRDRQLANFPPYTATRIELGFHSDSGVTSAVTARRGADGWTSTPSPIQEGKVEGLLSVFSRLRADDITADAMGPDELEAIGLNPPKVILSAFGEGAPKAEGGAEGEGEADRLLAELRLGNVRGQWISAQIPNRETIFELNSALAEFIPINLEAFQNHFVALPEPEPESHPDTDVESELEQAAGIELDAMTTPE